MESRMTGSVRAPRPAPALVAAFVTLLAALLAALALTASASATPRGTIFDLAAEPSWVATQGGGALNESAQDVLVLPNGRLLTCGVLQDGAIRKVSLTLYRGSRRMWTRTWLRAGTEAGGSKMALSADGRSVYVAGEALNMPDVSMILFKCAVSNGRLVWARSYRRSGAMLMPLAIAVDGADNVTVVGCTMPDLSGKGIALRWDGRGTRKWVWLHEPGAGSSSLLDVLPGPNGSAYVVGSRIGGTPPMAGIAARLSARGRPVWLDDYSGAIGLAGFSSAAARPRGGFFVGGTVRTMSGVSGAILRYSPRGASTVVCTDAPSPATAEVMYRDIAIASDNTLVAAGYTTASGTKDCYIARCTQSGTILGSVALPGAFEDEFTRVAVDAMGGYYATGCWRSGIATKTVATVRGSVFSGAGGFISAWSPVPSPDNAALGLAVDGVTAYVCGSYSSGAATGVDQFLMAYQY